MQSEAEFMARELAATRLSLGRMEAMLARLEEAEERREARVYVVSSGAWAASHASASGVKYVTRVFLYSRVE